MSVSAQSIVEVAKREVGVHEVPMGSNSGDRVETYQRSTSLAGTGWPWCAAFVEWTWETAGLRDHPANPSTYWMCRTAAARGELSSTPKVGGAIIWCGTHTGVVVGIGNGVVYTVEGNSGDKVTAHTRAIAGAQFINPKGIAAAPDPSVTTLYWLDDPKAKFVVKGPWRKRAGAEKTKAGLSDALQRRAKVLATGDGRFVLRIGEPPRRGPWLVPEHRTKAKSSLEKALGRTLIERSTKVRNTTTTASGSAEGLGKTT